MFKVFFNLMGSEISKANCGVFFSIHFCKRLNKMYVIKHNDIAKQFDQIVFY